MIAQETEQLRLALVADLDSGFAGLVRRYEQVVHSRCD